jgi:sugar phosphate isomerase/epimerase
MMTTYPDFTHPDKTQRERELAYLKADVALCSEIGIKYLRILAGQAHPETTVDEGIASVLENFHKMASFADQYKVGLLFEDHAKPGAWNRVDFCYPPDIFLKICDGIRDTSIRVNYDTGNITAYGADTIEILKQVIDITETIHVTDMAIKGKFSPVTIGSGVVPNKEVFDLLKQRHFNGWICIEEASGKGLEGIKSAHDYVRSVWNS